MDRYEIFILNGNGSFPYYVDGLDWLGLWCLTPLSTIFQLGDNCIIFENFTSSIVDTVLHDTVCQ
jgi:hypothetical protein